MMMKMLMLLWFAFMALGTATSSMKKPKPHIHNDDDSVEFISPINVHDGRDVSALLSFRNAVISDPFGSLLNWTPHNSHNVCSWNGIRCRNDMNRVVAITLVGLGLQGILSPYLGSLSFLRTLNLSGNYLSGKIPPELGQLKSLGILNLRYNMISSPVAISLSNCTRLQWLRLSINLTRTIPIEFGCLVNLEHFCLVDNNLTEYSNFSEQLHLSARLDHWKQQYQLFDPFCFESAPKYSLSSC